MALGNQSRRERRREERRVKRFSMRMRFIMGGIALGFVALLGMLIASSGSEEEGGRFPQVGDHWHADYSITLCGESTPQFPISSGGVHTHGSGTIHIHPTHAGEGGLNANLARFIASTGSRLTDNSIYFPSGVKYTNGDPCPNGETGQLFLRVNGITTLDIASYVPRDVDTIELSFEAR